MEIALDKVKYIGFAFGLLGLIALLVLSPEYRPILPGQANESLVGHKVSLAGIVKGVFLRNGNAFFSLENSGTIGAVFFRPGIGDISALRENQRVRISGTLSLYRNEFEIIVDKVKGLG